MKSFPRQFAALIALLLLAAQTASLSHLHADDPLPAGRQATVCDLCTGLQSSAPAPEIAAAAHHAIAPVLLADAGEHPFLSARPACAHRSRAPPFFRSI